MDAPSNDAGIRAHLNDHIRAVEREKVVANWLVLSLVLLGAWHFGEALAPAHMALAAVTFLLLVGIHGQICDLRADALRRELRGFPR